MEPCQICGALPCDQTSRDRQETNFTPAPPSGTKFMSGEHFSRCERPMKRAQFDYQWALECWREMMVKVKAGRPKSAAPPTLLTEPDGDCWYDRCVFPHCDCDQRQSPEKGMDK